MFEKILPQISLLNDVIFFNSAGIGGFGCRLDPNVHDSLSNTEGRISSNTGGETPSMVSSLEALDDECINPNFNGFFLYKNSCLISNNRQLRFIGFYSSF